MDEQQLHKEALHLLATLRTPGWKVAEELLDSALALIQEDALDDESKQSEAMFYRAQGARQLVKKFKAALFAASSVEKPQPEEAGLAQESDDAITD
jgi:hypothetical protein